MKKVFVIVSVLALASCWSGGRLDLWEGRNTWIDNIGSYSIEFFDQGPKLLKTEVRTEKNYKSNKVLTAYKGYTIADIKTYRKDTFASSVARINKNGALHSSAAPIRFTKNEERPVLGLSEVDGNEYYIIPSSIDTFVHLVKDDGSFYPKMGQIRDGKLRIIDPAYFSTPEDLRFEPVTTASSTQTEPLKGFDIKFDGLKSGKVAFIYLDYAVVGNEAGQFEYLTYPNKEGEEINIKGVRVKILFANDQKLDYMIVSEFEE